MCFLCGDEATEVQHVALSPSNTLSEGEWINYVKRGLDIPQTRSPITVTIYTCGAHQGAVDYFLDGEIAAISGRSLVAVEDTATMVAAVSSTDPAYVAVSEAMQRAADLRDIANL
jgi:hypothetical protein